MADSSAASTPTKLSSLQIGTPPGDNNDTHQKSSLLFDRLQSGSSSSGSPSAAKDVRDRFTALLEGREPIAEGVCLDDNLEPAPLLPDQFWFNNSWERITMQSPANSHNDDEPNSDDERMWAAKRSADASEKVHRWVPWSTFVAEGFELASKGTDKPHDKTVSSEAVSPGEYWTTTASNDYYSMYRPRGGVGHQLGLPPRSASSNT